MSNCERCKKSFTAWRKTSRFCSRKCANVTTGKQTVASGSQVCGACKRQLPKSKFNRSDKNDRSKYDDTCAECRRSQRSAAKQQKPWYFRSVTVMLCNARIRAEKIGVPFSLTREDITIPERCPVFGTPMKPEPNAAPAYFSDSSAPSIDRIIPALGYVRGNIIIVSCRANSLRGNATPDELAKLAAFYARFA